MKVHVVTSGEYSDFKIEAVFDEAHKEDAERFRDAYGYDWIEEYDLNPTLPLEARAGMAIYRVWIDRAGNCHKIEKTNEIQPPFRYDQSAWDVGSYLIVTAWAKDEAHAAKIANEKRAQVIAAGEWE